MSQSKFQDYLLCRCLIPTRTNLAAAMAIASILIANTSAIEAMKKQKNKKQKVERRGRPGNQNKSFYTPWVGKAADRLFKNHHIVILKVNSKSNKFGFDKRLKSLLDDSDGNNRDNRIEPLQTSLFGSSLSDDQRVYRVPKNKFEEFKKNWLEADPDVIVSTLDSESETESGVNLRQLLSDFSKSHTKESLEGMKESTRNEIARTLDEAARDVFTIYNATLIALTKKRSKKIEQNLDVATHPFKRIDTAFGKAIDELRKEGMPNEVAQIEEMLSKLADSLGQLNTSYSNHILSDLLTTTNGNLLASALKSDRVAENIVDSALGVARGRIQLLQRFLTTPKAFEKMNHFVQPRSSSGYQILPGSERAESARIWSKDYPWDDFSENFLLFLGTDKAKYTRDKIEQFLLETDKTFLKLKRLHKAKFFKEQAQNRPGAPMAEFSKDYRGPTSVAEVQFLTAHMMSSGIGDNEIYSQRKKVLNTIKIFDSILPQIKSVSFYRQLSDAALVYLLTIGITDKFNEGVKIRDAGQGLIVRLKQSGADRDVQVVARSLFGKLSNHRNWVGGLSHEDMKTRHFTMRALLSRLVKNDADLEHRFGRFKTWNSSSKTSDSKDSLHRDTVDQLVETRNDPNEQIWQRLDAARILNVIEPSNTETLGFLSNLLLNEKEIVRYGEGKLSTKNLIVQKKTVEELGRMKPHAAFIGPLLGSFANDGKLAKTISKESTEEAVKVVLSKMNSTGNNAKRALNYLNKPATFEKINTHQLNVETPIEYARFVLNEIAELGDVAINSLLKIKTIH